MVANYPFDKAREARVRGKPSYSATPDDKIFKKVCFLSLKNEYVMFSCLHVYFTCLLLFPLKTTITFEWFYALNPVIIHFYMTIFQPGPYKLIYVNKLCSLWLPLFGLHSVRMHRTCLYAQTGILRVVKNQTSDISFRYLLGTC